MTLRTAAMIIIAAVIWPPPSSRDPIAPAADVRPGPLLPAPFQQVDSTLGTKPHKHHRLRLIGAETDGRHRGVFDRFRQPVIPAWILQPEASIIRLDFSFGNQPQRTRNLEDRLEQFRASVFLPEALLDGYPLRIGYRARRAARSDGFGFPIATVVSATAKVKAAITRMAS